MKTVLKRSYLDLLTIDGTVYATSCAADPAAGTFCFAPVKYCSVCACVRACVLRTTQNKKQARKAPDCAGKHLFVGVATSGHKMSPLSTRLNARDSFISPLAFSLFTLGMGGQGVEFG